MPFSYTKINNFFDTCEHIRNATIYRQSLRLLELLKLNVISGF